MLALKEQRALCRTVFVRSIVSFSFLSSEALLSLIRVLWSACLFGCFFIYLFMAVKAGPLYLMAGVQKQLLWMHPSLIFTQCLANGSGGLSFMGCFNVAVMKAAQTKLD